MLSVLTACRLLLTLGTIVYLLSNVTALPCDLQDASSTWRNEPRTFEVAWRLDQVCENSLECYGQTGYGDVVQLCPMFIQLGDLLNVTLPIASFYELRPAIGELTAYIFHSIMFLLLILSMDSRGIKMIAFIPLSVLPRCFSSGYRG